MKKFLLLIFISVIVIFLTSCSTEDNKNSTKDNIIEVLSPITLSYNELDNRILKVRMVEGKYYEDWNPGAIMGSIYEGKFVFEVSDNKGTIIAQTYMEEIHDGENNLFTSSFDITFDDYNNDGDLDFTIGQYGNSNGNDYKIFTLRKDGSVETLKVESYPYLFISNKKRYYSTKLKKLDNNSFSKIYYDNSKNKLLEDIFTWEGNKFVHTLTKETED